MYFFLCYIFPFLSPPPHRIDYILKCIIFFLFGAGSRWGRSHRLLFISFYLFLPTTSVFALTRPRVQPLFTSRCRKSPSRQTTISRCDANHHEIALWRMDETRPARWNEMTRLLTSFFSLSMEKKKRIPFFFARAEKSSPLRLADSVRARWPSRRRLNHHHHPTDTAPQSKAISLFFLLNRFAAIDVTAHHNPIFWIRPFFLSI